MAEIERESKATFRDVINSMNYNVKLVFAFYVTSSLGRGIWMGNVLSTYIYLFAESGGGMLGLSSNVILGLTSAASGITMTIFVFPAGFMADKFRRDLILKSATGIGLASMAFLIFGNSIIFIFISLLLWGLFNALVRPSLEALFADWEGMVVKMGKEEWKALYERLMKPTEYYKYYEIEHLPLQSYNPGDVAIDPMEVPATYWGFCYTKPGHEKSLLEIFGKYVELYKNKNISEAFDSYIVRTGADLPACFYVMRGKTFSDLFGESEKAEKIAGEEAMALWEKFVLHLRKFEYKLGMIRPGLSYIPEQQ